MSKSSHPKSNVNGSQAEMPQRYYDHIALIFISSFLIIDFFPYFGRTEIIKPQFLYLNIINIVACFYIYFNPQLLPPSLVIIFKKSYILKCYLAFIVLCGVSIVGAKNKSLGVVSITETLVVFVMVANLIILLYNRLYLISKIAFLVGLAALFQVLPVLLNFKELAEAKSVSEALSSDILKGNTGNINILAASLMAKMPFIFLGILQYKNWKRYVLIIALIFSALVIFLINARASLVSLSLITIVFILIQVKSTSINKIFALKMICLVVPLIIAYGIANEVLEKAKSNARYASTTKRLESLNADDSSIQARLSYWENAITIIKHNPLLGIGLGNWRVESIPLEHTSGVILSLHTHNDFLELAAETGIINGILYCSIFVALLFINVRTLLKKSDPDRVTISALTLLLLIVYGVDALFNFPFYRPTMQLCFSFLIGLSIVNHIAFAKAEIKTNANKIPLMLIVIGFSLLYFTYYADKTSRLQYLILSDNINFSETGKLNGDEIINQNPKFPNVFSTSESFSEYAAIYYYREKKYDKAIKYFDEANTINPYMGRPDLYKSIMASTRGMIDSAYVYAKNAFYKRPFSTTIYTSVMRLAAIKRDTSNILIDYQEAQKFGRNNEIWLATLDALKNSGARFNHIEQFMAKGKEDFPNDSLVIAKYNATMITNFIVQGQKLFSLSRHREALEMYQKGLTYDPTNIYLMQNIGFYYINLGQQKQAIPYLLKALALPGLSDGKTEYYLSVCYNSINDKKNALKYMTIAREKKYAQASIL